MGTLAQQRDVKDPYHKVFAHTHGLFHYMKHLSICIFLFCVLYIVYMDIVDCLVVQRPLNCQILVHNLDKFNTITGHTKTAQQQLIHIMNTQSIKCIYMICKPNTIQSCSYILLWIINNGHSILMRENEIDGLVQNCSKSIANALW